MSFLTEVYRLKNAKAALRTALSNKGRVIPQSVKLDGYSVYINNFDLQLPSKCDSLVLNNDGSIREISYNNTVTSLDNTFFVRDSGLISISIPAVTSVTNTFNYCTSLTTVYMAAVTNIGAYTFANCSSLRTITCNVITPPTLHATAFQNTNNISKIYVPAESVEAYKSATNWSKHASKIQAIS